MLSKFSSVSFFTGSISSVLIQGRAGQEFSKITVEAIQRQERHRATINYCQVNEVRAIRWFFNQIKPTMGMIRQIPVPRGIFLDMLLVIKTFKTSLGMLVYSKRQLLL